MLIEQMHELAPDISLAPDYVDLSSDEGGDDHYRHDTMNDMGYSHNYGIGNGGGPLSSSSTSYLDGRGQQQQYHDHRRRMSSSDNNVPSSSINYFSGQLFGPNSGLDFGSDMDAGGGGSTPSGSTHSSKRGSNAGQYAGFNGDFTTNTGSTRQNKGHQETTRQIMLSPEQAREEEARIEEEQKARERTKSYNPDNVKIRIVSLLTYLLLLRLTGAHTERVFLIFYKQGVMPSTFVHPLVHTTTSNRSSKSRSPSTPFDNTQLPNLMGEDIGNLHSSASTSTGERMAKRPRTTSKEKSPIKEQNTIKEEDEPNPP